MASANETSPPEYLQLGGGHIQSKDPDRGDDNKIASLPMIQIKDHNSESEATLMMRGVEGGDTDPARKVTSAYDSSTGANPKIKRVSVG